MVIVGTRVKIV